MAHHPARQAVAEELHNRPFASLEAPCHAVFLALKPEADDQVCDRRRELEHLIELLDRFEAPHPPADATHYFGEVGPYKLKWENHTEFVTYTLFQEGLTAEPFDPAGFEAFPADWLAAAPGLHFTSALIRVERRQSDDPAIVAAINEWFIPESLAIAHILDRAAVVATDFRADTAGHMRFAIFAAPTTGPGRIGRVVQRLCEIETYKAMAMLGLPLARQLSHDLADIDPQLVALMDELSETDPDPEKTLMELLAVATRLERLTAQSEFRFGATAAYEHIVLQRIEVLREERFQGRQTLSEFMFRRFDPAMRTVKSTATRLQHMTERASRAGELLRTQVDVERSAQNQSLLESMNRRSDTQLRLQKTVEGLSVVAISYYAVTLGSFVTSPLAEAIHLPSETLTAAMTPIVVGLVWWAVHRIRKSLE